MRQRGGARGRPGRGIRVELSEKFLLALLVNILGPSRIVAGGGLLFDLVPQALGQGANANDIHYEGVVEMAYLSRATL